MIENVSQLCAAGNCAIGEIANAGVVSTVTMLATEFTRTVIAIFIIGAVVGVIVWELGKFMYHYGKRKAAERESESG